MPDMEVNMWWYVAGLVLAFVVGSMVGDAIGTTAAGLTTIAPYKVFTRATRHLFGADQVAVSGLQGRLLERQVLVGG
jgi:hypothetical protein